MSDKPSVRSFVVSLNSYIELISICWYCICILYTIQYNLLVSRPTIVFSVRPVFLKFERVMAPLTILEVTAANLLGDLGAFPQKIFKIWVQNGGV